MSRSSHFARLSLIKVLAAHPPVTAFDHCKPFVKLPPSLKVLVDLMISQNFCRMLETGNSDLVARCPSAHITWAPSHPLRIDHNLLSLSLQSTNVSPVVG
ncbi:hypothetical protein BU25DRAFT_411901 [Macroventuria anomochaeta]|uniref:Uncharacterized protein n=1 Tax=Macroventuria anomochaeta TaxID=301207 RepID=A0ACB6RZB5_9PLEO|nr:uncharacterized protein BU25DRAFT_411901 [Macroventuria anomochaeta]KAF2626504.1 hypothetical protein BU25DRAFT_411901 [Macroventuria anomochaeta]